MSEMKIHRLELGYVHSTEMRRKTEQTPTHAVLWHQYRFSNHLKNLPAGMAMKMWPYSLDKVWKMWMRKKKLTVPSENALYLTNAAEALAVVKWEALVTEQRGELRVRQSASCGLRGHQELRGHSQGNEWCWGAFQEDSLSVGGGKRVLWPLLLLIAGGLQPPTMGTQQLPTAPTMGRAYKDNTWSHHATYLG